jgi:hypothetical protein
MPMDSREAYNEWFAWAQQHGVVTPAFKDDGTWSMDLADYGDWRALYEDRLAMLKAMADPADVSVPADEIRFVQSWVTAPPLNGEYKVSIADIDTSPIAIFRLAAEARERIALALEAEIGDRATAERLAGVVVRALEEGA